MELQLKGLPWIQADLKENLSVIVPFLLESFRMDVSCVGLYGSWQRGDADPKSDVDLVVFLIYEVAWFDSEYGIINRLDARKDKQYWHAIEKEVNAHRSDARDYSIAVVTPSMLKYYSVQGPIHLQNWVHALRNCYTLWNSCV